MRETTGRTLTFFFVATFALGAGLAHGQRKPGSPLDHLPPNIEILPSWQNSQSGALGEAA